MWQKIRFTSTIYFSPLVREKDLPGILPKQVFDLPPVKSKDELIPDLDNRSPDIPALFYQPVSHFRVFCDVDIFKVYVF